MGDGLFKTFIFGVILGLAAAAGLFYVAPVVNLEREASLVSVKPNGGKFEQFHINLPNDRVTAAKRSGEELSAFPEGLQWPEEIELDGAETEVFKLRNRNNVVVGIAARISNPQEASGMFVQWVLHMPARGTIVAGMQPTVAGDGHRPGRLLAGTREFGTLSGSVQEFYNSEAGDKDLGIRGRLEIETILVGAHAPEPEPVAELQQ